jgi:tRNA (guanine-N7-)-methyltransferase
VIQPALVASAALAPAGETTLAALAAPLPLDRLAPGSGPWEVELGFGKGRHLLARALAEPERRFLGVEVASAYYRRLRDRARRAGAANLVVVRGEAAYLLAAALPAAFAAAVHVYFPDPWPKSRHHKRRLFDPDRLDLVLRLLRPGGRLLFATDHLAYGELVQGLLASHPSLRVAAVAAWPEGPRTHYEAKYLREGRPILRLVAQLVGEPTVHPAAGRELTVAEAPER